MMTKRAFACKSASFLPLPTTARPPAGVHLACCKSRLASSGLLACSVPEWATQQRAGVVGCWSSLGCACSISADGLIARTKLKTREDRARREHSLEAPPRGGKRVPALQERRQVRAALGQRPCTPLSFRALLTAVATRQPRTQARKSQPTKPLSASTSAPFLPPLLLIYTSVVWLPPVNRLGPRRWLAQPWTPHA